MNHTAFANIQISDTEKKELAQSRVAFENQLQLLHAQFPDKARGFFGPDSITWLIYREPSLLLGGVSALLLQIAHPAVAEGVKLFSNFHQEYLHRAQRTFAAMSSFYFGSTDLAIKTARHLFGMHGLIRGTVWRTVNGKKQELPFCAKDPELLQWVLATLIDTSIVIYEQMHRPLSPAEKEQFFEESKIMAQLMGIPLEQYPSNWQAFRHYYQQMLSGAILEVNSSALALSKAILHPPYASHRFLKWTGVYYLPPALAKAYQLVMTVKEKKYINVLMRSYRVLIKWLPKVIRHAPPYYQALYRIKKAQGKGRWHLGRFYNWLAQTGYFPLSIPPA